MYVVHTYIHVCSTCILYTVNWLWKKKKRLNWRRKNWLWKKKKRLNGPHSKQAHARKLSEQKSKSISNSSYWKKIEKCDRQISQPCQKKCETDFNFFVENQTKALAVLENEYDTDYKDLVKKRKTLDIKRNEYQQAYKKRKKVLDGKRNALVKEFGQEARVVVIKKKEQFEKYAANQENKRKTHVNKILALLADSL